MILIMLVVLLVSFFSWRCYTTCCESDTESGPYEISSELIHRGGEVRPVKQEYEFFPTRRGAMEAARRKRGGLEPVLCPPKKGGDYIHYHPHGRHIIEDGRIINYHYQFGPVWRDEGERLLFKDVLMDSVYVFAGQRVRFEDRD